ncbi:hypothetical protein [Candidatus Mycolicibacterium alkanivorans]|uniref:Uncharacterized protein n=1 Tax=Candidatus Mycolicibacterium alkanivorans TaxID=2954114 RepID=A0ABS9YSM4_9MYCO|nr:hypothetical protein [Candidatus Mycolicibacterium alkanivorans]MCI4674219.1 hypothetical protein [Candidatus Mycolicibacterium alkanivorans]
MASQSLGPRSASQSSNWYASSSTCNRSYLMADWRAGVIALILLGVLALVVWF